MSRLVLLYTIYLSFSFDDYIFTVFGSSKGLFDCKELHQYQQLPPRPDVNARGNHIYVSFLKIPKVVAK